MENKELSALELLDEIGNNMSPEKATRALILIPKLRAEIERLMPLDSPAFENTFQANIELHERLGDIQKSDCCNAELLPYGIEEVPEGYELPKELPNYCTKCQKECTYHWGSYNPFPTSEVTHKARYTGGYDTLKMIDHQWAGDCAVCGKVWSTQDTMGCDREEVSIGKFKFKVFIGACCNPRFDIKTGKYKWEKKN